MTSAELTPRPATMNYPPCDPGPGDDRCIQLYEPGVANETNLALNEQLGPFGALTVLPGRLRGTGNSGVDGLYFFEVALVSVSTGQIGWLSSGDPVIDNRGGASGSRSRAGPTRGSPR